VSSYRKGVPNRWDLIENLYSRSSVSAPVVRQAPKTKPQKQNTKRLVRAKIEKHSCPL